MPTTNVRGKGKIEAWGRVGFEEACGFGKGLTVGEIEWSIEFTFVVVGGEEKFIVIFGSVIGERVYYISRCNGR